MLAIRIVDVLQETFKNFISDITRHECYDYIGQIGSQFENVYINYEIFIVNIHLIKNICTLWTGILSIITGKKQSY